MAQTRELIIVETPFQLLCAFEYIQTRSCPYELCIRESGVGRNDAQMATMTRDLGLMVACRVRVSPGKLWSVLAGLAVVVSGVHWRYDRIVLGSYFSRFQRTVARALKKNDVVLLDDGMATLLVDDLLTKGVTGSYNVFSMFDLRPERYASVTRNRFESLLARYETVVPPHGALFIGQRLVDIGALDESEYLRIVEFALGDAKGPLIYVPHRTESPRAIEAIRTIEGVQVIEADVTIEYLLLRDGWYPERLYSVMSTALVTLTGMFPRARACAIWSGKLDRTKFTNFELIWKFLREHPSISVVELDT